MLVGMVEAPSGVSLAIEAKTTVFFMGVYCIKSCFKGGVFLQYTNTKKPRYSGLFEMVLCLP